MYSSLHCEYNDCDGPILVERLTEPVPNLVFDQVNLLYPLTLGGGGYYIPDFLYDKL